jgi:LmbE family N-acetylglucosaminyl deacetylase
MINLTFNRTADRPLQILCLGSHSDDIEIGCGGTILGITEQYPDSVFHWVVFSSDGVREEEGRRAAILFAGADRLRGPTFKHFRDGFMPFMGAEVKEAFEELRQTVSPDLIFTHNPQDAHQDHRLIAELTWNTFRNHLILEYEIPKYDGDMGRPNAFVPIEAEACRKKLAYLMDAFESQRSRNWFQQDTFSSLMRLRGMECNAPSGFAEAFYCRKLVLGVSP